jgi:tryptophan synthase alpha chain
MRTKNRLTALLERKKSNLLSIYLTAGYPGLHDTLPILSELEKSGVDFVEIGFPFSDPLADGKTIQQSSEAALKNGMSLELLFEDLMNLRGNIAMPVLLMGYLNPILQFGIERFAKRASEVGVDGTIIPDLPLDFYQTHFKETFEQANLSHVFLVTPQTEESRVLEFAKESSAFLYAVSGFGVTGKANGVSAQSDYLSKLKSLVPDLPVMVGFGVRSREDLKRIHAQASGAVIGSAFIEALTRGQDPVKLSAEFVRSVQ